MIFLFFGCSSFSFSSLPEGSLLQVWNGDAAPETITGSVFFPDLRQFGHFAWRNDLNGVSGERCSFHLHDCVENPLSAWGATAIVRDENGDIVASEVVQSNGEFSVAVPTGIALRTSFQMKHCSKEFCFSFADLDNKTYEMLHPEEIVLAPGEGHVLEGLLFHPQE